MFDIMTYGRVVLGTCAVTCGAFVASISTAQLPDLPNTGMADSAALINAMDRFASGNGALLTIPLFSMRGITNEGLNAGGSVTLDLASGLVASEIRLMPASALFELWLVDNRLGAGHTTLTDAQDVSLKVSSYAAQPQAGESV
jgi:hypothetical protein